MEDLDAGFALTQKRELLALSKRLEKQRTFRAKIQQLHEILADQDRVDDHALAAKLLKDYERRLANVEEAIALSIKVLGLVEKKFDLEKQLAKLLEAQT
ncbi:hypothetical protein [Bradyrhizobium cenepequi]